MTRRIDTDVPDPSEELDRKTRETLDVVLHNVQAAEWSFQRALDALDVLWGVTSGLVGRDVMDDITAAHSYCRAMKGKGHDDYDDVLRTGGE